MKKQAFTLVELIVVITILAVLATVAFISFQWYTTQSRDTVRLADLKSISQAFNLQITQDKQLPAGTNMSEISASWTTLFYQWTLSKNDLASVWVFNGWFDPLTWSWVIYAVNTAKNKFQIWMFFENNELVKNISWVFADNSDKYFNSKWEELGILLTTDTKLPVWVPVDILQTSQEYVSHISNDKVIQWTWSVLSQILPNSNCKNLYKNGITQSGLYDIYSYSTANNTRQVYCDFSYPDRIITDELRQTWDIINWDAIYWENDSNPTNTAVVINSPISSQRAIHQTGAWVSEYQISNFAECLKTHDRVVMRLWTSKNIQEKVFHHRWFYATWGEWYIWETNPQWTIIDTKVVDGRTWNLEEYSWEIAGPTTRFDWYIWYNSSITNSDFYFTWVRLWCE